MSAPLPTAHAPHGAPRPAGPVGLAPAGEPRAPQADEALLATLERAFARLGGPDTRIDAAELQKALGLRSEYLARRMLAVFDKDRSGNVCYGEFLAAVRRLVFGTVRDKLYFAFSIHDHNGDGVIERVELLRMIALGLAEDEIAPKPGEAERLTNTLLLALDRSRDGRISFDEFEAAIRARPEVLDRLTRSEARWIAPNEDLLARMGEAGKAKRTSLGRLLENRVAVVVIVALWVLAHLALGVNAVLKYQALGANPFILVARFCGACINFDGALILLPMMRHLLTWLRKTPVVQAIPVDDAVAFHRLVGHTMFGLGVVHTAAHLGNYTFGTTKPFVDQLFLTKAGATGFVLLLVFATMWLFSRAAVRRSGKFELFYFTHLLYVVWLCLALAHGPVFWIWAGVPIAGFAIEQLLRLSRRGRATEVIAGHALRSGVTRLELRRPAGFAHRAGDYMFLKVPEVAPHEWHPFTISSAPERDSITVHVRSLGNWTSAIRRLVEAKHASGSHKPVVAHVDGPYGTASAHVFESRCAVLVGAGIGVTPFASILESILMRAAAGDRALGLRKVHFYWLSRDSYSFEWFAALLARLEEIDKHGLLDCHIHMTSGQESATSAALGLARDLLHSMGDRDRVTGLRAQTRMGPPDWDRELAAIAAACAPEPVDVYFCGPPGLANLVKSASTRQGLRFHQEHF